MRDSHSSQSIKLSNMKLTHQRMTNRYNNTPEAILDWLEEQLENRGIDAVVYTRYILSLLQEDEDNNYDGDNGNTGIDAVHTDSNSTIGGGLGFKFCCEHHIRKQTHINSCVKENIKPVTTTKWKHKRYLKANPNNNNNNNCGNNIVASSQHSRQQSLLSCQCCGNDYCSTFNMNTNEERKLAVVECLKSASEQEFGIESFVDELCAKLKNIKLLSEADISTPETKDLSVDCKSDPNSNPIAVSPQEQAMKYYAAFPALDSEVSEGVSHSKPNNNICAKKFAINRKSIGSKWNGQKIIEFMTNSISNNGLLDGLTNDNSTQQTLTTANNCPENALKNNRHLDEKLIESKFNDNIINEEEMVNNNNDIKSINRLLLNSDIRKFVYCGDIEKNVLTNDGNDQTLVVNKNKNNNYREESDKFERLVNKFNSNIASIWYKTGESWLSKSQNIWSFDSSFSSNQSSASPSPKLNTNDFWSTIVKTESTDGMTTTTPTVNQMMSNMTPISENSWESSVLQSIGGISGTAFNQNKINDQNESWLLSDYNLMEHKNGSESTITLQNHQENSPFIEFNSLISSTPKQPESGSDCLLLSTLFPTSSAVIKSDNLTPEENLLTSPKTHFQPIKQESFDRDSSDDGSVTDLADHEVNKLVICSEKCPNNGDHKPLETNGAPKARPVSTSLDELASFIGPFNDLDSTSIESFGLPLNEEIVLREKLARDDKMSDKSTNTETEPVIELKSKLEPIMESNIENEPEYQDLCNMINEVLRNGLQEEELNTCLGISPGNTKRTMVSMDDWYDDDMGDNGNDFILSRDREKRLSWNYYWDTYDTISETFPSHQNELFAIESDYKKLLNEDISSDDIRNRFKLNNSLSEKITNECFADENCDEVFDEELFNENNLCLINESDNECQTYDEAFNNYCLAEENEFDFDIQGINSVVGEYHCKEFSLNDVDNTNDYFWSTNDVISDELYDLEQPFRLKMKPRSGEGHKRNRKPCSFFIEGNCKRSDCKYSHDISTITCKYWEEGFCFKAHLCPFLHGYVTDTNADFGNNSAFKLKNSYTIESESDFPALATVPNTEDNTTQQELEIVNNSVEHHFFDFRTKSVTDKKSSSAAAKAKLPIMMFMKKKVKKRKDRNLQ